MSAAKEYSLLPLGRLPRKATTWLLPPLLPMGRLVLVEGQEGIGKGFFAAWVAVQIASGKWSGVSRSVIWISSEEEPEEIQLRLLAAGWDRRRHAGIYVFRVNKGDIIPTLPADLPWLAKAVEENNTGLLVVDVLRDHCAPTPEMGITQRSNNDETWIRPAARAWNRLAEKNDCLVLGLHHRNKSGDGTARSKSTGSGAWRQAARCVVCLAKSGPLRAIAQDKVNGRAEDQQPFFYEVASTAVEGDDGEQLDVGLFTLGDRVAACPNIDAFEKAEAIELDPIDMLQLWLEDNIEPFTDPLPNRTELMDLTGLSQHRLREAINALKGAGVLTEGHHRRLFWTPTPPSSNGQHHA